MKAASIQFRFADFLRQHPPFNLVQMSDLLALAATGRVQFHESGETLFLEGSEFGKYLYIIQTGTVDLYKIEDGNENLVDVRGAGDMLGLSRMLGNNTLNSTARTRSDTILYAVDWDEFYNRILTYQKVRRYFASYFSMAPGYSAKIYTHQPGRNPWDSLVKAGKGTKLFAEWPEASIPPRHTLFFKTSRTVRDVAIHASKIEKDFIIVTTESGRPLGALHFISILQHLAQASIGLDTKLSELELDSVACIKPASTPADMVIGLLKSSLDIACITDDGTPKSPCLNAVNKKDIRRRMYRLPTDLNQMIKDAPTIEILQEIRSELDKMLLQYLEDTTSTGWINVVGQELNDTLIRRVVKLARQELTRENIISPPGYKTCWLLFGSLGRMERILRPDLDMGMIVIPKDTPNAEPDMVYHRALLKRTQDLLNTLTHSDMRQEILEPEKVCLSMDQWKQSFRQWIQNPVENAIMKHRGFFDLRLLQGSAAPFRELKDFIRHEIHKNDSFVSLLAHDSLGTLPPLTIYQNYVLDRKGARQSFFDIKRHAIRPLVELARLFALREGYLAKTHTVHRLHYLASHSDDAGEPFTEAAEAFQTASRFRARAGLSNENDGRIIRPTDLTKIEQEVLKSVFRVVQNFMRFTSKTFGFLPHSGK